MTYANKWKRAHGTTVTITPTGDGAPTAQVLDDCEIVGIPGESVDLIEKTTLGSARKEYDPGDQLDSDTIEIKCPWTGASSLAGWPADIDIALPSGLVGVEINALIVSDLPQPAEVGGLLARTITIKPLGEQESV